MNQPPLRTFRLRSTLELEVELGGELQDLRVDFLQADHDARLFRVRLLRFALMPSIVEPDEEGGEQEVTDWPILEDASDLLEPADQEFEADSLELAEERVLAALAQHSVKSAWFKH